MAKKSFKGRQNKCSSFGRDNACTHQKVTPSEDTSIIKYFDTAKN